MTEQDKKDDDVSGFAAYRVPGQPIQYVAGTVEENPIHPTNGFYIAPFDVQDPLTVLISADQSDLLDTEIDWSYRLKSVTDFRTVSQSDYERKVEQAIALIKSGEVKKVVLSRGEFVEGKVDTRSFFLALCDTYPTAFCYCFWTPVTGMWVGATPETLVGWSGSHWLTMALAGTQSKVNFTSWTQKEEVEQALVVEDIERKLHEAGFEISIGKRETVEAGNLVHLQTPMTIDAPGDTETGIQLAKLLHPTAAVCGLATDKAKTLIQEIEQRDRGYYTGYLGPVGLGNPARFFVNLRCAEVFTNGIRLHVGGGITKDSDPASEWEETKFKTRTLLSVMEKSKET